MPGKRIIATLAVIVLLLSGCTHPQPSFADMIRLHVLAKSCCALYSSDNSIRISIEPLSIAAAAITVFPGEVRRYRTTVHGRDAVIREPTEHGHRHRYYLAIPGYPDHVMVADVTMRHPTRRVLDDLTTTLVELSRPSG